MEKKYVYFQPEYVSEFKCDGSKCGARCCKGWMIDIDKSTYKKYSHIKPKSEAKIITKNIKINSELDKYIMRLNEKKFCPMLTENNLCSLQLKYGEDFLSITCTTYPRHTCNFGKFFERSLTLTCPVAAELILFQEKPMDFKFIDVPPKIHSNGGKIKMTTFPISEEYAALVLEIQITMISILQERRFSLDQRLIVLGLFLDKLQELFSDKTKKDEIFRLATTYQSEKFLMEKIPTLLPSFSVDTEKFITFMVKFIAYTLPHLRDGKIFLKAFLEVLEIKSDEKDCISVAPIVNKYKELSDARNEFLKKYSTFLENFLVNELFMNTYPWRFDRENITKNFAVFLISYKIFELIMFSVTQSGLSSKEDLLKFVDWFTCKTDHNKSLYNRFFELLKGVDDIFLLMAYLL